MSDELNAIKKIPLFKKLEWIIPAGILIFVGLKIYTMVVDSKLKKQQANINKYMLLDYAGKYPENDLTKQVQTPTLYEKEKLAVKAQYNALKKMAA